MSPCGIAPLSRPQNVGDQRRRYLSVEDTGPEPVIAVLLVVPRLIRIQRLGVYVTDLDAVDETPVIDVDPYFQQVCPRGDIRPSAGSPIATACC
ncbi:hypothetical protein [Streptomyces sp. NPDC092903]|uniref:hypothetical protein n=1 Tax=Streptomyces sp. NPDC092903 TaxID=3366017 RepID=UPI003830B3E0